MSEASGAILETIMGLRACGIMTDEQVAEFDEILNSGDPHWVIGGHVDLATNEFIDPPEALDYVGSYETYGEALKVWRGKVGWTIDDATMKYFVVRRPVVADRPQTLFGVVRNACMAVDDGRQPHNVLASITEEVGELAREIEIAHGISYKESGPDGVIGEALDMIASGLDVIYLERPDITERELVELVRPKMKKWIENATTLRKNR